MSAESLNAQVPEALPERDSFAHNVHAQTRVPEWSGFVSVDTLSAEKNRAAQKVKGVTPKPGKRGHALKRVEGDLKRQRASRLPLRVRKTRALRRAGLGSVAASLVVNSMKKEFKNKVTRKETKCVETVYI